MRYFCLTIFVLIQTFSIAISQSDTVINPRFNVIQNSEGLATAMSKLKIVKSNADSSFVVVHFGDSHIQGDNLSGTIRKNMQGVYGSAGEGILFPYSACKSFGPKNLTTTVTGEWSYANLLNNPEKYPIGITGYTLVTKDKAASISFSYNPTGEVQYGNNKIFEQVVIWHSKQNFKLILVKNGSAENIFQDTTANANGLFQTLITNYRIGTELKLQIDYSSTDSIFNFHGITFENQSKHGLQYNRCGVVGATFLQLADQQDFTLAQLKEIKPDLIIFSYGSNESYDKFLNIDNYYKRVSLLINRVKNEIPGVNIIFTNTPDTRSRNRYPVNTIPINKKLKFIASETSSGFWDLNMIMGGDNSMKYWLKNELARKDQLHFTKAGYELQGNLFSSALLDAYSMNFNSDKNQDVQRVCDSLQLQIEIRLKELVVKNDSINSTSTNTTSNTALPANTKVHYVQKNETLSSIAKKYGVTVKQLCERNGLTERSVLQIKQKIVIK